jgi:hypothetical protein
MVHWSALSVDRSVRPTQEFYETAAKDITQNRQGRPRIAALRSVQSAAESDGAGSGDRGGKKIYAWMKKEYDRPQFQPETT